MGGYSDTQKYSMAVGLGSGRWFCESGWGPKMHESIRGLSLIHRKRYRKIPLRRNNNDKQMNYPFQGPGHFTKHRRQTEEADFRERPGPKLRKNL
ncbi:uncharacterized protein RCO7_15255 [Rhynchosporium graminicola]|uniref:Uncharacterized protein n=1 Tax=Rhynchosporium graminicola TaxID=2792576 RepID=A0A1E1LSW8_9HELO|nr:uncharacterized protein RCO7_15255 [Rhynchosporium commune]